DPLTMDRTVIAIPLLRQMQEDLDRVQSTLARFPDAGRDFNAAIEHNPAFPGGLAAAHQQVVDLAKAAADRALKAETQLLEQARAQDKEVEQKRYDGLKAAVDAQTIGPLIDQSRFSFGRLHASVIRRLMAANEAAFTAEGPVRPIVRIHPARFEVIIDLNLE